MAKENVRQHFIPQCYLKNFSDNGNSIFIYSKKRNKCYGQAIAQTAQQKYFYAIPEKYLNREFSTGIDSNFIEKKILAEKIEILYCELLTKILQAAEAWSRSEEIEEIFSNSERDLFAALIAIQYLRMPNIRDKYWGTQQKAQKERNEIVEAFKKVHENIDCSEAIDLNRDDDYAPVLHSELFLDEKLIADIQNQLTKKIWRFGLTENGTVFTSDNPILLKPHLKNQPAFYEGFAMSGVEIIFPISKNVILSILDEETFPEHINENNRFNVLTNAELLQYNCYQYIFANEEVFSPHNNFKFIDLPKLANGDITKEVFIERPIIKINGK